MAVNLEGQFLPSGWFVLLNKMLFWCPQINYLALAGLAMSNKRVRVGVKGGDDADVYHFLVPRRSSFGCSFSTGPWLGFNGAQNLRTCHKI